MRHRTDGTHYRCDPVAWVGLEDEARLRNAEIYEIVAWNPGGHLNDTFVVTFTDGREAFFKPETGERPARNAIAVGTYWRREIAAYRLDRLLGFGLVPVVVERTIEGQLGALIDAVPEDGRSMDQYATADQDRMAVLDYAIANTDRHGLNWMTHEDGRPAAIDNGLSLPTSNVDALLSPWVFSRLNRDLGDEVLAQVRSTDDGQVANVLIELGIEAEAITQCLARLAEARTGQITNRAWAGTING